MLNQTKRRFWKKFPLKQTFGPKVRRTESVVLKITDINGKIFCFRLSVQIILFGNWTFSARTYEFCHVSFFVHTFYQMHVSLRLNFSENIAASGWH